MLSPRVNLFLVGAAKAGTSSLWAALRKHPEIFAPADELNKEPSYFSAIARHNGISWYEEQFSDGARQRYRLDASTAYLTSPEAAAQIYAYNPDARILIVLRDPVARAYSLYNWMVADGYEWAPNFERALDLEDIRFAAPHDRRSMPQYFWNYMYRRSGLYADQVSRYTRLFGDRVLLVSFAELVRNPDNEIDRILGFLGVARRPLAVERENPSLQVLNPRLSFTARRAQQWLSARLPARFAATKARRDFLLRAVQSRHRPAPMRGDTKARLEQYFAPELDRVHRLFGLDLSGAALSPATRHGCMNERGYWAHET